MKDNVKVALIVAAAILIGIWYYVHNQPVRVCARALSKDGSMNYDYALVLCAKNGIR